MEDVGRINRKRACHRAWNVISAQEVAIPFVLIKPHRNIHQGLPPKALLAGPTQHHPLVTDPLGVPGSYFHSLFSSLLCVRGPRGFDLGFPEKAITRQPW